MLRNTFIHLPGIGPHRERAIWERGILNWEQFLAAAEKGSLPGRAFDSAVPVVCRSLEALASGDPGFFKPLLPPRETWRLYPEFADRAVFLDIETQQSRAWTVLRRSSCGTGIVAATGRPWKNWSSIT